MGYPLPSLLQVSIKKAKTNNQSTYLHIVCNLKKHNLVQDFHNFFLSKHIRYQKNSIKQELGLL